MANQVNPVGLVAGSPLPLSAGSAPARPGPARSAAAPPSGTGSQAAAVAQVNQHLDQTELKLQVDTASGRTVFQVIQQGTGEVVLQVPSEEILGMSRRIRALENQKGASGALVDQQG